MARPEPPRKDAPSGAQVSAGKPPFGVYNACCPTRAILDHVADKWAGLVLGLLARGPRRFNALRREVDGISPKVLSGVLKRLERDGLVSRRAFPTVPVTVEYAATPLGLTLDGALAHLVAWAEGNIGAVLAAQAAYDRAARSQAHDRQAHDPAGRPAYAPRATT